MDGAASQILGRLKACLTGVRLQQVPYNPCPAPQLHAALIPPLSILPRWSALREFASLSRPAGAASAACLRSSPSPSRGDWRSWPLGLCTSPPLSSRPARCATNPLPGMAWLPSTAFAVSAVLGSSDYSSVNICPPRFEFLGLITRIVFAY